MGFSPGEFVDRHNICFHLEGKPKRILLWDHTESRLLLDLDLVNAKKLLADLELLVGMIENDAL